MFNWLLKLIPAEYKWQIAAKKIVYTISKLAIAGLMYGTVGKYVGAKLSPDQITQIQAGIGALTAGGLEALHDYLKLKFPDNPLL